MNIIDKSKEIRQDHKRPLIIAGIAWKLLFALYILEQKGCLHEGKFILNPKQNEETRVPRTIDK